MNDVLSMSDFQKAKKALEKNSIKDKDVYLVAGVPGWFTKELLEKTFPGITIVNGVKR